MSAEDKKKKVLEGVKRASERSGFPTIPKKRKLLKRVKRALCTLLTLCCL
ncbi:hypothetical protein EYB33_00015 (plasmid) [Lysinibacillus sphaericus]|nr:hypothetical protein [Lysinibacillus sphaericus]UDK94793.1 hypothetical protein EYB33_00015 [Lysinibacillus sphaericus]